MSINILRLLAKSRVNPLKPSIIQSRNTNTVNVQSTNFTLKFTKSKVNLTLHRLLATDSNTETPKNGLSKSLPKSNSGKWRFAKYTLSFLTGAFVYIGYAMYSNFNDDKADTSEEAQAYKPNRIKKVSKSIDRGVPNPGNVKITLYQYITCPFCCKVRAYLDYYGYKYDLVEVNSVKRNEIKWSEYKKVPILAIEVPKQASTQSNKIEYDPEFIQLNDSSIIISAMETFRLNPNVSIKEIASYYVPLISVDKDGNATYDYPNKYFVMLQSKPQITNDLRDEREWRSWVDTKFIHAISPNVYRTLNESLSAFKWYAEYGEWDKNFGPTNRYIIEYSGTMVMYLLGKRLKKKYNLKDDVRESLYDLGVEWGNAVGSGFRGGEFPNLADLALYGALESFRGCQAFGDLMKNCDGIRKWFDKCDKLVKESKGKHLLNTPNVNLKHIIAQEQQIKGTDAKKKRFYFF